MTETLEFPPIEDIAQPVTEVADEVVDIADIKAGKAMVKYGATEKALADLRSKYEGAKFDLTTTKGDKAARSARLELVTLRTALEKKRKALKAPALEIGKLIDSEAARITTAISALEAPIDQQIKDDEERRAAEAARKAAGAAFGQALHLALIERIRGYAEQAKGLPSDRIAKGVAHVEGLTFGEECQDMLAQYRAAHTQTLATLRTLLEDAQRTEAAEAQRLENERVAAELAARSAELERQAQELEAQRTEATRKAVAAICWPEPDSPAVELAKAQANPDGVELSPAAQTLNEAQGSARFAKTHPTVAKAFAPVSAIRVPQPAGEPPLPVPPAPKASAPVARITLGQINERLAPISITADGLASMGFHFEKDKASRLYPESDVPLICAALIKRLSTFTNQAKAA